ncbi:helix-turn-helix transcriptional regulator [Ahniella affigens]|nr:helix-turn-helix transcriptional regulator [Ahniella affigens]
MWLHDYRPEPMSPTLLAEPNSPRLPQLRNVLLGSDASVRIEQTAWVLILNLRGRARVHGPFGSLQLPGRHWLILEAETAVAVSTRRQGLCLLLGMTEPAHKRMLPDWEMRLLAGMGRMSRGLVRILRTVLREATTKAEADWQREMQFAAALRELSRSQSKLRALMARAPGKSLQVRLKTFARLQRACLMMACQVENEANVTSLAAASRFSVWYFSRAFRRVYGEPPHAYATRCRLRHAAWLMRSECYSASDVASMCGFDNASSFARAFRREIGCTPSAYRARFLASSQGRNELAAPGC